MGERPVTKIIARPKSKQGKSYDILAGWNSEYGVRWGADGRVVQIVIVDQHGEKLYLNPKEFFFNQIDPNQQHKRREEPKPQETQDWVPEPSEGDDTIPF